MISFDLTGKMAIVTGGTRGLGYSMAEGLMEAGAKVIIFGSSPKVHDIANEFSQQGLWCKGVAADLGNSLARKKAFYEAVELLGNLDILVNCAGIQRRHTFVEFPESDWNDVMNVNLNAPFDLCQLAVKEFMKKDMVNGKIINIVSMLSFFGGLTVPAYAASKGGMAQLTKAMCNELASQNINVNAIAPGYMDTEMNKALTDKDNPRYKEITERIPAGKWGTGEDLKGITIFLASSASNYVNGAIIPVDGGYLVK